MIDSNLSSLVAFIASFMIGTPLAVFLFHWIDHRKWERFQAEVRKRDDESVLRDFWLVVRDGRLQLWEFDPGHGVKAKFHSITRSEAEFILANRRRWAAMTREQKAYPFRIAGEKSA